MEYWTDLPWWLRMILSLIVLALGGALFWLVSTGDTNPRGAFIVPALITLAGLVMFATSFPYDRNKYNF